MLIFITTLIVHNYKIIQMYDINKIRNLILQLLSVASERPSLKLTILT